MRPNNFQQDTSLFHFEARIDKESLLLSIEYKTKPERWTRTYTYKQLPTIITNLNPSLFDVLLLFEQPDNFVIENSGVVILLLKTVHENKFVETHYPLKLNLVHSEIKKPKQISTSEMYQELKNLQETVSMMGIKIQQIMQNKSPRKESPHKERFYSPRITLKSAQTDKLIEKKREQLLEGRNIKLMNFSQEQEKKIKRLERKMEETEDEIREIKEILKEKPSKSISMMMLQEKKNQPMQSKKKQEEKLDLSEKKLGDDAIEYLGKEEKWSFSLTNLDLYENNLTAKTMVSLSRRNWPKLLVLNLNCNIIGDQGVPYLRVFPELKQLYLNGCGLKQKGVEELSKLEFASNLNELYLGWNSIGDQGTQYLYKFNNLTLLCLYFCGIRKRGIEYLQKMNFAKLHTLGLQGNQIGVQGQRVIEKWKQRQKGIEILFDDD